MGLYHWISILPPHGGDTRDMPRLAIAIALPPPRPVARNRIQYLASRHLLDVSRYALFPNTQQSLANYEAAPCYADFFLGGP